MKSAGKTLTDQFANTRISQARALADILNSTNIGLKEPQSISEKQDEQATERSQKVDEWKEATDLLHKIKDTLGKRVRKSDNFKKDHTYYILNPQTGTWEKAQTSVSAIAENVYKRGVWGRSEDDMAFDINQPDENNPAIRLGKDFDRFARDYFSKKGVKQENFPNYSKEEFNALKRDFKAFTDMLDERFGKDNWRINSSPITVGGVVKRGKITLL